MPSPNGCSQNMPHDHVWLHLLTTMMRDPAYEERGETLAYLFVTNWPGFSSG